MKREEKNQQTRRRIMDSALAEFAEKGYGYRACVFCGGQRDEERECSESETGAKTWVPQARFKEHPLRRGAFCRAARRPED